MSRGITNPFHIPPRLQTNDGVFSNSGMPHRFAFSVYDAALLPGGGGTASATYYAFTLGGTNEDSTLASVTCYINKSAISSTTVLTVYKYLGGPVAIFDDTSLIGYIIEGTADAIWDVTAPAQSIFNAEVLAAERTAFFDAKHVEQKVLLYAIKVVPSEDRLEYVDKREDSPTTFYSAFYNQYALSKDGPALYISLPEKFVITDLRTNVANKVLEDGDTAGLQYDTDSEFNNPEYELAPTGTSAYAPSTPDISTNFWSVEIRADEILSGKTIYSMEQKAYHYATDLIANLDEGETFVLYATVTLGGTPVTTALNTDFAVTVAHVVGVAPAVPSAATGERVIRLCTVSLFQDVYSITTENLFGCEISGGGLLYIPHEATGTSLPDGDADNIALRWDHDAGTPAWLPALPVEAANFDDGSFVSGGKIITGARKGGTGLIQLEEKTLTLPAAGTTLTASATAVRCGLVTYNSTTHKLYQADVKLVIAGGVISIVPQTLVEDTAHEITTSVSHALMHV